jgi:hypothetical protein
VSFQSFFLHHLPIFEISTTSHNPWITWTLTHPSSLSRPHPTCRRRPCLSPPPPTVGGSYRRRGRRRPGWWSRRWWVRLGFGFVGWGFQWREKASEWTGGQRGRRRPGWWWMRRTLGLGFRGSGVGASMVGGHRRRKVGGAGGPAAAARTTSRRGSAAGRAGSDRQWASDQRQGCRGASG